MDEDEYLLKTLQLLFNLELHKIQGGLDYKIMQG